MVDRLKLADDIQPDLWEFILEQVQEEREKMFDGCLLPKERCKTRDLVRHRRTDVLRRVLAKVADARNDAQQNDLLIEQFREA